MSNLFPVLCFFLQIPIAACQIPTDSLLFARLRNCYEIRAEALKIENKQEKRGGWKDWLPSFGIGYTPSGEPRPTVSVSASRYLDLSQRNRQRKNLLQAALLDLQAQHLADSLRLTAAILDYQNAAQPSPAADSIRIIQSQFLQIATAQFQDGKISPEQFFGKKLAYLQTLEAAEIRRRELAEKAFQVLTLASGSPNR